MSVKLTPSKRKQDGNVDGKGKLLKVTSSSNEPSKPCSSPAAVRLLCPVSKIDSVVGKDGHSVSQIQQETGAIVSVEEVVKGCDERILKITLGGENEVAEEKSANDDEKEAIVNGKADEREGQSGEAVCNGSSKSKNGISNSSLQTALMLVFDRIVDGNDGNEEEKKSSTVVLRVLVPTWQVGCILGKGGSVIKQMASESGAQIRILPRDKLPSCVSDLDEVVQITGEADAVRKALQSVYYQLFPNPSRANNSGPSSNLHTQPYPKLEWFPQPNRSFGAQRVNGPHDADHHSVAPPLSSRFHERALHGRMKPSQEILSFRLLCHAERLGGVIGKGGQVIRAIQQDTGCDVTILDGVPDSEYRVIVVSGQVHPDDRISAVQDAVVRIQARIARAVPAMNEQGVTARLLVSSNQISCLLGKGGSIMAEMRKLSRSHIRVLAKDLIPKCALEDEEVVQIDGEFESVKEGLMHITARLQHYFFREAFPPLNPAFLGPPPYPSFFRREFSPPGMYSDYRPSFHKFDDLGIRPPHGGFDPRDDRAPFMHSFSRFDGPTHISDRRHWAPQGLLEGGDPGLPDSFGGPHRTAGFGRDDHSPVINTTTVEVVVPSSVVPEIYGEDGECLKQIREISDAKIIIAEAKPGAAETEIIISGTPEQTHAAQSLIQAFVIIETEST